MSQSSKSNADSSASNVPKDALKDYEYPQKKRGKDGEPIPIFVNYFKIGEIKCPLLYRYYITISVKDFVRDRQDQNVPQRNRMKKQKKIKEEENYLIFKKFHEQNQPLFSSRPVYDGKTIIYSKTIINFNEDGEYEVSVIVPGFRREKKYDIKVSKSRDNHELNMSALNDPNSRNVEKELQALNCILKVGFF